MHPRHKVTQLRRFLNYRPDGTDDPEYRREEEADWEKRKMRFESEMEMEEGKYEF